MRVAVISDIHGNLEALQAVMADIVERKCDRIICLGDIVGYGPNPSECLRLLSDAGIPCLKGNHDDACAQDSFPFRMNPMASSAILWTQQKLSKVEKLWLENLPYSLELPEMTFAHASPCDPSDWVYVLDSYEAANAFQAFDSIICFVGHTHEPVAWINSEGEIDIESFDRLHMAPHKRYLINVGSVGQPRDRDPRAAYVIYDSEKAHVDLHRVTYDIEKTQDKIVGAGLPVALAQRLELGR